MCVYDGVSMNFVRMKNVSHKSYRENQNTHLMFSNFFFSEILAVYTLTLRLLMSYIYGAPILDVSRSHTTTQHSR